MSERLAIGAIVLLAAAAAIKKSRRGSSNFLVYRGLSPQAYAQFQRTGKIPLSRDVIPRDHAVMEYALERGFDQAQLPAWARQTRSGINATTDEENAAGYGKVVAMRVVGDDYVLLPGGYVFIKDRNQVQLVGSPNRAHFTVESPAQGLKAIEHQIFRSNHQKALKVKPSSSTAVLIPCAGTKPFTEAPSHKHGYLPALQGLDVDTYVVAEPLGVVPQAWSEIYPNYAYDFPPSMLKGQAREALVRRIAEWMDKVGSKYDRIVAALPQHHMKLVRDANKEVGLELTDASIGACRDSVCSQRSFRATSPEYRKWLRGVVQTRGSRATAQTHAMKLPAWTLRLESGTKALKRATKRGDLEQIVAGLEDVSFWVGRSVGDAFGASGKGGASEPQLRRAGKAIVQGQAAIFDAHGHIQRGSKNLVRQVQGALTPELLHPEHPGGKGPLAGHCYVATQALWHLMGGAQSGYTPHSGPAPGGDTHWWLVQQKTGKVLDPTSSQFPRYDYAKGTGRGFLTKDPSQRARVVMSRVRSGNQ
jgi:hypothetical protein